MKLCKNIYRIISLGIFALYCIGCSDLLDKNPLAQISSETFWNSESEAEMALAGVYARLRSNPFSHKDCEWDVMAGDVCANQSHSIVNIAQGNVHPTSGGIVSSVYSSCFQGISSCNFFLANIDKAPISDEKLNLFKAEVQFLRALFYFTLTDVYGGVPLYTEPVTIEDAKVKQASKEEVTAQIMSDLDFAIANLPDNSYSDGHAVKGSALALKAKVLLFNEQWLEAANLANEIIQSGVFKLYDDFRTLFLASGQQNNSEIIFSTRYLIPDITYDLDVRWCWHGVVNPRQELVDAYECIDGLPISSSPLYDPSNWKLNRDPRLAMTVKAFEETAINSAGEEVSFAYNGISGTGFNPVKYCDWDALPIDYSTLSEQDWIILRYADVLLMYAEAMNEASGPDASVYAAVNEVRARVDMPDLPEGLSQEEMRQRIRNERRVELVDEISMCSMNFNRIKSGFHCTFCSFRDLGPLNTNF
jgi:starch-binding outer membrane protein, SusD/RagB family